MDGHARVKDQGALTLLANITQNEALLQLLVIVDTFQFNLQTNSFSTISSILSVNLQIHVGDANLDRVLLELDRGDLDLGAVWHHRQLLALGEATSFELAHHNVTHVFVFLGDLGNLKI